MIDLHMHTKYSDGTDDLITLLKKAQEKKLNCISITDHNTCKAYEELESIDVKKYFTGNIIKGVELNTKILGIPIEVLGYNVNTKFMNARLPQIYVTTEQRNKIELERIYEKCIQSGIKLGDTFLEDYDSNMYVSKYLHGVITNNIANKKIIDEESWENSNVFYRKCMSNPETMFYVNTDDILPDFNTVIKLVKDAGGLLFVPHIFEYRDNAKKILDYILKNHTIDGIECFYTTFTDEQSLFLQNICKQRKLLISGGSDYHSTFKPDVDIGVGYGNLKISDNIITNWPLSNGTLTFIGRDSGFGEKNNSAYIDNKNKLTIIDCGFTVFEDIKNKFNFESYSNIEIIITHLHNDHAGSLSQIILYLWFIYNKKVDVLCKCQNIREYLDITGTPREAYNLKETSENIQFIKTEHTKYLDAYGFTMNVNNKNIVYTGDTNTLEPFMKYINKSDELYMDVSKCGGAHIKIDDVLDTLIHIKENETKIFLMHIDDKEYIKTKTNNKFYIE